MRSEPVITLLNLVPIADAVGTPDSVFLPYASELIEAGSEVESGEDVGAATLERAREHFGLKPS